MKEKIVNEMKEMMMNKMMNKMKEKIVMNKINIKIMNDNERKVKFYLDDDFHDEDIIGMHPNDNTASLWLKVKDLKDIIKEHGNEVYEAEL